MTGRNFKLDHEIELAFRSKKAIDDAAIHLSSDNTSRTGRRVSLSSPVIQS
jgi:hypothetical protein